MSRILVVVNRLAELGPRQTTSMIIAAARAQGRDTFVADVNGLSLWGGESNRFVLRAVRVPAGASDGDDIAAWAAAAGPGESLELASGDLLLIRTNPGRDEERAGLHDRFLEHCLLLQDAGVAVANHPASLRRLASKAALLLLPSALRPAMVVSSDMEMLLRFIRSSPAPCVVKPLVGSRGRDVLRVDPDDDALEQTLQHLLQGRTLIAQEFVAGKAAGDQRVIALDGRPLEIDGHVAGIARVPGEGDFRGNLHAGGRPQPLELTESQRSTAARAAALLDQFGVRLAGVDLIGDQVIEFNVFSTGGLFDATRFTGVDFAGHIVRQLADD